MRPIKPLPEDIALADAARRQDDAERSRIETTALVDLLRRSVRG